MLGADQMADKELNLSRKFKSVKVNLLRHYIDETQSSVL